MVIFEMALFGAVYIPMGAGPSNKEKAIIYNMESYDKGLKDFIYNSRNLTLDEAHEKYINWSTNNHPTLTLLSKKYFESMRSNLLYR